MSRSNRRTQAARSSESPTVLAFAEVASFLNLPASTLWKLRAQGTGPPAFKIGRRLYVRRVDLDAWINEMATTQGDDKRGKT
jgi:predicted DNA-binding transcriptional regulator AlpA